jgi:hypothetical protein
MFGQFGFVAGVFVAAGVVVLAASELAVVAAGVDALPAAWAIAKPPIPDPTSRPPQSMAVAAIFRNPVARRGGCSGSCGGGGGGMSWSPSMVCTSWGVDV